MQGSKEEMKEGQENKKEKEGDNDIEVLQHSFQGKPKAQDYQTIQTIQQTICTTIQKPKACTNCIEMKILFIKRYLD